MIIIDNDNKKKNKTNKNICGENRKQNIWRKSLMETKKYLTKIKKNQINKTIWQKKK